jgi:glycosyltransferase involved in cell wall biosynthesis
MEPGRKTAVEDRPPLSIGMPVYNAERFVEQGIRSILNQTVTDFELILSDNASTDRTAEICRDFASQDRRIRFYKSEFNKGGGWNHNRVLELARGRYFKWQSNDDLCDPSMVEKCIDALERDPSAVLAHPETTIIDQNGGIIEHYALDLRTDSPDPAVRFSDLIMNYHWCYQIYGVIRKDILDKTGPMGNFVNGDGVLLANLALHGHYSKIPEHLFFSRRHEQQSSQMTPTRLRRRRIQLTNRVNGMPCAEWWNPRRRRALTFPQWRQMTEYVRMVSRAPLSGADRLRCHRVTLGWMLRDRRRYIKDLVIAADQILSNLQEGREQNALQRAARTE